MIWGCGIIQPHVRTWQPPEIGELKLNVDATVIECIEGPGLGGVRDSRVGSRRYGKEDLRFQFSFCCRVYGLL